MTALAELKAEYTQYFSTPDVAARVLNLIAFANQAEQSSGRVVDISLINDNIPDLQDLARNFKRVLRITPEGILLASREVPIGEDLVSGAPRPATSPESELVRRQRSSAMIIPFASNADYFRRVRDLIDDHLTNNNTGFILPNSLGKREVAQRRKILKEVQGDLSLASEIMRAEVREDWRSPVSAELVTTTRLAVACEVLIGKPGFNYTENPYLYLLGFHQLGLAEIDFVDFPSGTALAAHFKLDRRRKGCWNDREDQVRAYHKEDEPCSPNTSKPIYLGDKPAAFFGQFKR